MIFGEKNTRQRPVLSLQQGSAKGKPSTTPVHSVVEFPTLRMCNYRVPKMGLRWRGMRRALLAAVPVPKPGGACECSPP